MSITIATLKAAGLTAEQIVSVFEKLEADQAAADEAKRIKNRDRMRSARAARALHIANDDAHREQRAQNERAEQTTEFPQEKEVKEGATDANVHILTSFPSLTDSKRSKEGVGGRAKAARGIRLPPDWQPTQADLNFAVCHLPDWRITEEISKFRDYWHARAGPGGVKLDWSATWRNWIRTAAKDKKFNGHRTIMEAADDLLERVRGFDAPAPGGLCDGAGQDAPRLLSKG